MRMLEDGKNVILTDEFRTRLYMTTDDAFEAEQNVNQGDGDEVQTDLGKAILERRKIDPTYGFTAA